MVAIFSCYILGSIEFCDSFMKGHTTADQYGAQKFGFISSTVVLVTIVSISATASCFGVDIFRPPYLCSNILRYVSAGEKCEYHKHVSHFPLIWTPHCRKSGVSTRCCLEVPEDPYFKYSFVS